MLRLATACLLMALTLLLPAAVEAVRCACVTAWTDFTKNGRARFREGEVPGEPSGRSGTGGATAAPAHDESVNRGVYD